MTSDQNCLEGSVAVEETVILVKMYYLMLLKVLKGLVVDVNFIKDREKEKDNGLYWWSKVIF